MKQTTNMQRAIQYLVKIFKALNTEFFDGELPTPIITIQSTPKAYGHFTPWDAYRIHGDDGEMTGAVELNVGAGTLDRPITEVVCTLQHELIHYYCYLHNIKETSRSGAYHNKKFKEEAEKRGLHIEYDSRIGWSITEETEEILNFVISYGFEDIRIGRNEFTGFMTGGGAKAGNNNGTATIKPKGNSHKLVCPCCGVTVRYTTKVAPRIQCMDCGEQMIDA